MLTPVSVEEMNRSAAQKSNGIFGLNTLTIVFLGMCGACAVLVVVLLIVIIRLDTPHNERIFSSGGSANIEDITKERDGTQIRSLVEEKSKTRLEKGGK